MSTIRSATDVLAETIDLRDLDVLDVGCGEGGLVRWLRDRGTRPRGAECGAEMRARAIAADPEHAADYVDAPGEDLPFDDSTFDLVVYSYSLHHVPTDAMTAALREARRVLRPGGTLYVVEPVAEAPDDAVAAPVVDERVERAAAQAALDEADGFALRARTSFESEAVYPDFETWAGTIVGIDPDRAELMDRHRDELREKFHRMGEHRPDGWAFRRTNLLRVLTAM